MNEPDVQVGLSEREKEVLFLAGEGLTDKEIALRLEIGPKTVRTYWDRMRAKLGAASRTEVLAKALHFALDAIAESEKRLRSFVDNMPVMFYAHDEHMKFIMANQECERVSGYSSAEFYEGAVLQSLPSEAAHNKPYADYRDIEIEVRCADDSKRVIAWSSRAQEAPIEGWAGWAIGIDVTERVRAQKSLEQSEANYRRLLETSSQGVWLVDTQHRTLFANQRLADMFACTVDDILSNDEATYLDNSSRQALRDLIATGPIGGTRTRFTFRFRRNDGVDLWTYVDVAPIFDLEGDLQGHAAILTDISRSKALEQATSMLRDLYETILVDSKEQYIRFDRLMSVVNARLPDDLHLAGLTSDELEELLFPYSSWVDGFERVFRHMETVQFDGKVGKHSCRITLMPEPTAQQRVGYVLALLKGI